MGAMDRRRISSAAARARVGFFILAVWVSMLFISFTSAYVKVQRPAQPEPEYKSIGKGLIPVDLPVSLLVVNTVLLLGSSVTIEFAGGRWRSRWLWPGERIPGITIGREKTTFGLALRPRWEWLSSLGNGWLG